MSFWKKRKWPHYIEVRFLCRRDSSCRPHIRFRLRTNNIHHQTNRSINSSHTLEDRYQIMMELVEIRNQYLAENYPLMYKTIADYPIITFDEFKEEVEHQQRVFRAKYGQEYVTECKTDTQEIPEVVQTVVEVIENPTVGIVRNEVRNVLARYGLA